MGLDITAYSQLEYLETMDIEAWEEKYWQHDADMPFQTAIASMWEPAHADRAAPIARNGVYRINGKQIELAAGSYSGYNQWRNWLSETMLNRAARYVWEHRESFVGKPFYELIDFSDCEGIIGSVAAAKLVADFAQYAAIADQHGQDENGWYARKYHEWANAFALAADDGMVEFH